MQSPCLSSLALGPRQSPIYLHRRNGRRAKIAELTPHMLRILLDQGSPGSPEWRLLPWCPWHKVRSKIEVNRQNCREMAHLDANTQYTIAASAFDAGLNNRCRNAQFMHVGNSAICATLCKTSSRLRSVPQEQDLSLFVRRTTQSSHGPTFHLFASGSSTQVLCGGGFRCRSVVPMWGYAGAEARSVFTPPRFWSRQALP